MKQPQFLNGALIISFDSRHDDEVALLSGPKQDFEAGKASSTDEENLPAAEDLGHFHGRHHHHKKGSRPGHDVEPAIVGCVGEDCEECDHPSHFQKPGVAVMPKSTNSTSNGWVAIGVCTFLVVVFATTTVYYWMKAKKMAKDMFAGEGHDPSSGQDNLEEDVEDSIPSPIPPKPTGKKPLLSDDEVDALESVASPKMLNNHTKSPVEFVKKLCDKQKVNLPPSPASQANGHIDYQKTNGGLATSVSCISIRKSEMPEDTARSEDDDEEHLPNGIAGEEKNLMELLLAAAAKRDRGRERSRSRPRTSSSETQQKMAKAASMSELEASQLEPLPSIEAAIAVDHNQHHHHGHVHSHQSNHNHNRGSSANHTNHSRSRSRGASNTNISINRDIVHVHARSRSRKEEELDYDCMDCVHSSLLRPAVSRPMLATSNSSRRELEHQHSFHHPHYMTLDNRGHRSRHRHHDHSSMHPVRHYHGSHGHLLEDEDLLQQCLATLMMDAALLRQQQQLQQEQLQLQQEQLQHQQNVIQQQQQQQQAKNQKKATAAAVEATAEATATDTQSVIESIAGDVAANTGTTIVTVDHLQVSVEVEDDDDEDLPIEDESSKC